MKLCQLLLSLSRISRIQKIKEERIFYTVVEVSELQVIDNKQSGKERKNPGLNILQYSI